MFILSITSKKMEVFNRLLPIWKSDVVVFTDQKLKEDFGLKLLSKTLFLDPGDLLLNQFDLVVLVLLVQDLAFCLLKLFSLVVLLAHHISYRLVQDTLYVLYYLFQDTLMRVWEGHHLKERLDGSEDIVDVGSHFVNLVVADTQLLLPAEIATVWHHHVLLIKVALNDVVVHGALTESRYLIVVLDQL
jgi:hypothetical protein